MDDKLYTPMGESPPNRLKTAKKQNIMPSIAQQDYIIIDWGGADIDSPAAAKFIAEVKEKLLNIAKSNPINLLSVVFRNYREDIMPGRYTPIVNAGYSEEDGFVWVEICDDSEVKYLRF